MVEGRVVRRSLEEDHTFREWRRTCHHCIINRSPSLDTGYLQLTMKFQWRVSTKSAAANKLAAHMKSVAGVKGVGHQSLLNGLDSDISISAFASCSDVRRLSIES